MKRILLVLLVILVVLGGVVFLMLEPIRRAAVVFLSDDWQLDTPAAPATFDGGEPGQVLEVDLVERVGDLEQPTELAFVPGQPDLLVVLQRRGRAAWINVADGARGELLSITVLTRSEQGLLGLAFHPQFLTNGRLYLNYVAQRDGGPHTVVEEWRVPPGADLSTATATAHAVVLTVSQPYANHNGGQLLFGPDGMLYVPLGDGGLKDDIHGHGQNRSTLLGSILRLDVDAPAPHVPADNPFVGQDGVRPEIWAYGVRNPWRVTFAPDGRLIVADVGQNQWEEVGFARAGASLGWNTLEGRHCFPAGASCAPGDHVMPFWDYEHPLGLSITGGQVYAGSAIPALRGLYVVGDFVTGRLWALPVPADDGPVAADSLRALGKWDMYPASFATAPDGGLWIADYGRGRLMELVARD